MRMKSAKKLMLALLLSVCLLLSGCMLTAGVILGGSNDSVSKEQIFEYVAENADALSAFPYVTYKIQDAAQNGENFLKSALGNDTIVKDVYRYSPSILQFYCGGTGNVTSSAYDGFYYSAKDIPYAFEFDSEARFTQISEDVYEWQSEDRQRAVFTERIQPNWFWFHQIWD